ncbi:MAG: hypothetical protein AAF466_11795, partial [Bacteroidota bacterium]
AIAFYEALFSWNMKERDKDCYDVYNSQAAPIAQIYEVSNQWKGKYEYWVCVFGVKDVQKTLKMIEANGGQFIFDEGNRILCSDGTEAFFYIQNI